MLPKSAVLNSVIRSIRIDVIKNNTEEEEEEDEEDDSLGSKGFLIRVVRADREGR